MRATRFPYARTMPALLLVVAAAPSMSSTGDPLPSWRDGAAKTAILAFVEGVTDESGAHYVPPAERIAVFDNDGTLWCEKPLYTQLAFMVERAQASVEAEPELAGREPYKSLLAGTLDPHADMEGFMKIAMATHTGMTQSEFAGIVGSWFARARHPRFERRYDELIYQPMLELLDYLRENRFDVWICTGGGMDFVRCIALETYGIPPENVIGTTVLTRYEHDGGKTVITREPELVPPVNDGPGKPVNIDRRIGRVPIMAVGNSDGDLDMMRMSDDGVGPALMLLVHHDDAEREYDYDKGTEKALEVAADRGWSVVSIAQDFARVFPAAK